MYFLFLRFYLQTMTGLWFLECVGMFEIVMFLPLAWLTILCILQIKDFSPLNMLCLFIVMATSIDDVFVFMNSCWNCFEDIDIPEWFLDLVNNQPFFQFNLLKHVSLSCKFTTFPKLCSWARRIVVCVFLKEAVLILDDYSLTNNQPLSFPCILKSTYCFVLFFYKNPPVLSTINIYFYHVIMWIVVWL